MVCATKAIQPISCFIGIGCGILLGCLLPSQVSAENSSPDNCIIEDDISICAADLLWDTEAIGDGFVPVDGDVSLISVLPPAPPILPEGELKAVEADINQSLISTGSNTCSQSGHFIVLCH